MKIIVITDTHSAHIGQFFFALRKFIEEHPSEKIVLFHCGDLLQMTRETYFSNGQNVIEPFIEVRKLVSDSFMVPGNNDYYPGENWPIEFCNKTGFECVVTNPELLRDETTTCQYSHRSFVFSDGAIKYAVLGLMTSETQFCANNPCKKNLPNIEPHESIISEMNILQKEHTDIARYFILSHLGMFESNPTGRYDDIQLAEALGKLGYKNVTICGGHVHLPATLKRVGKIAITSGENHVSGFTVLETDSRGALMPDTGSFVRFSSNAPYDKKIGEIDEKFRQLSQKKVRMADIVLEKPFNKEPAILNIDANDIRRDNTFIANFTADALSQKIISLVLYPRGAILPPPFQGCKLSTYGELIEMFNVSNKLVSCYLTGEELIQVFSDGLKMRPSVLQPSEGLTYHHSITGEITSVKFQGAEIFADQVYSITTTDWIYGKLIKGKVQSRLHDQACQTGEEEKSILDDIEEPTVGEYVVAHLQKQNHQGKIVRSMLSVKTSCESRVIKEEGSQHHRLFQPGKRKKIKTREIGIQCDNGDIDTMNADIMSHKCLQG